MTGPQSLGDASLRGYKLKKIKLPMPPGRREIVQEIEKILSQGQVQWIKVSLGDGISYGRLIKEDVASSEDPEVSEDDLVYAARNAEVMDFVFRDGMNKFEYLFRAFSVLSRRGLKARALAFQSIPQVGAWLMGDEDAVFQPMEVFGVECIVHKDIPHGTALLIAAPQDSPENISYSIKLDMDLEPEDPPEEPSRE